MGYPLSLKEAFCKFSPALSARIVWDYVGVKLKSLFKKLPQESFKQYGEVNFGKTLYDLCFGNYSQRVWGCSAEKLSVEFARRKLPNVSLGAFFVEMLTRTKPKNAKSYLNIRRYLYHRYGIGNVFAAIAQAIQAKGGEIIYNAKIRRIDLSDSKKVTSIILDEPHGALIKPDWVISTLPFDVLLDYLSPAMTELKNIKSELPFYHGIIVNAVVKRAQLDTPHWMYLVNQKFYFNRLSETKNFSKHCAPDDLTLIMLEKICAPNDEVWEWSVEQWRSKVEADLGHFGVKPEEIGDIFTTKMPKAFPFYKVGYESKKRQFLQTMSIIGNLVSTGRYGLFLDINMHDAMVLGMEGLRHLVDGRLAEFYRRHEEIPLDYRQ